MSLPLKDKKTVHRDYKRVVLGGPGGVGKSTALATVAKNPLVIDLDGRFPNALVSKAQFLDVEQEYESIIKTLHQVLAEEKLAHDWLIFDTATKVMSLVEDYTIKKDCSNSKEKYNAYSHGLKFSPQYFKELLDLVDRIQQKHHVNAAFVCHTKVKDFKNPMGENYNRNGLDLPEEVANKLRQWADYVGYAYFEAKIDKDKHKAIGEPERFISFTDSPLYDAKNSPPNLEYSIPARLNFDKEGKWAEIVFGETQDLVKQIIAVLQKMPKEEAEKIRKEMDAAGVWSFGVAALKDILEAGKKKLAK